ncbi:MAG: hypothetical protein BroJett025_11220 [Patescibacteria group bacterium]|nr:MAG: hypothetical protein BroJett025_11220 [Patescibacteria group bacterium]
MKANVSAPDTSSAETGGNSVQRDLILLVIFYAIGVAIQVFGKLPIGIFFNLIIAAEIAAIPTRMLFAPKVNQMTANSKKHLGEEAHEVGKGIAFLFFSILVGIPAFGLLCIPYILLLV